MNYLEFDVDELQNKIYHLKVKGENNEIYSMHEQVTIDIEITTPALKMQ